ncbi:hypothetical protein [Oceanobacillus saliphilus]|uniref:hypothetical protein n=1 Tax=Oceanobacillus saliphilus TaxID=2925834 RepID=UPI00201D7E13|nr:hypothetical protein [Oceanobacillus saliphilus]
MNGRYVLLIAFLSLVINGISLYNLLIGYISLFIMLIVLIPNIFIKIIEIGKNAKARGADNIIVKAIMDFEKNTHSKAIYIFGIIFLYLAGGSLLVFQIYQYDYIDGLVTSNVNIPIYYSVVTYLIGIGYVLFGASLITMTIHFRKLFREALLFQKNDESRYVEM